MAMVLIVGTHSLVQRTYFVVNDFTDRRTLDAMGSLGVVSGPMRSGESSPSWMEEG